MCTKKEIGSKSSMYMRCKISLIILFDLVMVGVVVISCWYIKAKCVPDLIDLTQLSYTLDKFNMRNNFYSFFLLSFCNKIHDFLKIFFWSEAFMKDKDYCSLIVIKQYMVIWSYLKIMIEWIISLGASC